MFTWCSKEEWESEYFDFDWIEEERGLFETEEQARADAKQHSCKNVVILRW